MPIPAGRMDRHRAITKWQDNAPFSWSAIPSRQRPEHARPVAHRLHVLAPLHACQSFLVPLTMAIKEACLPCTSSIGRTHVRHQIEARLQSQRSTTNFSIPSSLMLSSLIFHAYNYMVMNFCLNRVPITCFYSSVSFMYVVRKWRYYILATMLHRLLHMILWWWIFASTIVSVCYSDCTFFLLQPLSDTSVSSTTTTLCFNHLLLFMNFIIQPYCFI